MSRSGNQYVYTVEVNGKLEHVYKNRRNLNRRIRLLIDEHLEDGWELVQDHTVRELFINLRAKAVNNGVYRNALLRFNKYGHYLLKQIRVKCWVIKSERIT